MGMTEAIDFYAYAMYQDADDSLWQVWLSKETGKSYKDFKGQFLPEIGEINKLPESKFTSEQLLEKAAKVVITRGG
jgi:hypothetical protein